ncbi:rab15 effector protein [Larimichthys crocea]|uniref:rab15 effector protein n=1 Tax=Larimichthys crocea TaxID=215358 RepID=UPI000F5FF853|nr:rab15 effector protein [Larimichthys crocea]
MGQAIKKPSYAAFQNSKLYTTLKRNTEKRPAPDPNAQPQPSREGGQSGGKVDLHQRPDPFCVSGRPPSDLPPSTTDQTTNKSTYKDFQNSKLLASLKRNTIKRPSPEPDTPPRPSIFDTLKRPPVTKPTDFITLFNECICTASSRTQEYLLFKDPEDKFHPSPETLTQVFLMTYVTQSVNLNLIDSFNCTAMTPEQRILLGVDWVWAVLEKPTKNPRIQIAVQVLHLPDREDAEECRTPTEACSESVQIAQKESSNMNMYEKMVNFCTAIGKDCYALFLFFGKKNDKGNIYGVLSNNFDAAIGKCNNIDRALIENFFKGSRYLHTPSGMMQAINTKKEGEPLTLMMKFS